MKSPNSIHIFFIYLGLSMLVSAIKTDIQQMAPIDIIESVMKAWIYNFVNGVPGAFIAMFAFIIYNQLKKKTSEEISNYHT